MGYYRDIMIASKKREKASSNGCLSRTKNQRIEVKQHGNLMREEQELLELQTQVEEYITGLDDIEIRNIMTLYYVEDMTWIQVAHGMNRIYQSKSRCYTADSCRCKHDRFLDKLRIRRF